MQFPLALRRYRLPWTRLPVLLPVPVPLGPTLRLSIHEPWACTRMVVVQRPVRLARLPQAGVRLLPPPIPSAPPLQTRGSRPQACPHTTPRLSSSPPLALALAWGAEVGLLLLRDRAVLALPVASHHPPRHSPCTVGQVDLQAPLVGDEGVALPPPAAAALAVPLLFAPAPLPMHSSGLPPPRPCRLHCPAVPVPVALAWARYTERRLRYRGRAKGRGTGRGRGRSTLLSPSTRTVQ